MTVICTGCRKREARPGKKTCEPCAERYRQRDARQTGRGVGNKRPKTARQTRAEYGGGKTKLPNEDVGNLYKPSADAPPPAVERQCLNCRRPFTAAGRFERICGGCKDGGSQRSWLQIASTRDYEVRF